jgi:hypothetical protein
VSIGKVLLRLRRWGRIARARRLSFRRGRFALSLLIQGCGLPRCGGFEPRNSRPQESSLVARFVA